MYRHPAQSSDTGENLYDQIAENFCQNDSEIIGDFNLPVIK